MTILIFIIILAILILVHEFGHFIAAKKNGVLVEEFGIGFPPRLFAIKKGETLYSVNLIPFGGFVKVYGEEYHQNDEITSKLKQRGFVYKKPWQKSLIIVAGILGNFILSWILISYLVTQGVPQETNKVTVQAVQQNSPADESGLTKNDVIKEIVVNSGTYQIDSANKLIDLSKKFAGKSITLVVLRSNQEKQIEVFARKNPPAGQGPLGIIISSVEIKKYSWYEAPIYGFTQTVNITQKIVAEFIKIIGQLVTFQKPKVDVAGPIGIAKFTGQAIKFGANAVVELTALLSLNLAVINIFPFPALDGGRLMFVLYEWVSRRKVNKNVEKYANFIGLVILLSLALVISVNDIIRLYK